MTEKKLAHYRTTATISCRLGLLIAGLGGLLWVSGEALPRLIEILAIGMSFFLSGLAYWYVYRRKRAAYELAERRQMWEFSPPAGVSEPEHSNDPTAPGA